MTNPINPNSSIGAGHGQSIKPPEPVLPDPLRDLAEFAREVLKLHENMQAATRRDAANRRDTDTKRSFVETRHPRTFANQPGGKTSPAPQLQSIAAAAVPGAFYNAYVSSVDGHTYLQGGTVTAGDGTATVADIKIIDSGTGPVAAAGHHLYLQALGDGVLADDVLIPGWNLTSVAAPATAATVPDNTLPTALSETGKYCYIDLGVFTADDFFAAGSGNLMISFCPGNYRVERT